MFKIKRLYFRGQGIAAIQAVVPARRMTVAMAGANVPAFFLSLFPSM
jgi:hypothetical protein